MANRNVFKKHIKLMLAQDRIEIQRKGDVVIICDSPSILKLPYSEYRCNIMPLSGIFSDIRDGESIDWRRNTGAKRGNSQTFFDVFDNTNDKYGLEETAFLHETGAKRTIARVCVLHNQIMLFNDGYLRAMEAYCGGLYGIGGFSPVKWAYGEFGCLLIPMKPDSVMEHLNDLWNLGAEDCSENT